MLLKQYYLGCLAHASYLIADEATGTAVIVDPQRDIDQYLHDTTSHGWHIDYVFLTHFHAAQPSHSYLAAGKIQLREQRSHYEV
jgi:glyoxylase-like metal-dependent hydrolase (beta-lactamase superfamily II)